MSELVQGSKVFYVRQSPYIIVGKSMFAICRLCGEPVQDRQKKSAHFHKRCAWVVNSLRRRRQPFAR